jgi:hypothetical protein
MFGLDVIIVCPLHSFVQVEIAHILAICLQTSGDLLHSCHIHIKSKKT